MPPPINQKLEDAIEQIANENKMMTMGLTVRDIQGIVKQQLGFEPATSTITRVLRRLGIDNEEHTHHWKWKAKKNDGANN